MSDRTLKEPLLKGTEEVFARAPIDKMEQIMKDLNSWDPYYNQIFFGHEGAVWSTISTLDNHYIFSGSEDKSIIIWDAITGKSFGRLEGHTNTVNALELADSERLLISGAWDNSIKIWDWKNKVQVGSLDGHTGGVYCFSITKDTKFLLSGSGDYKVRIWNIGNMTEEASLECAKSSVFGLALTSDDKTVLAGGWDGIIRIWNFETKALTSQHDGAAGVIQSLAVTTDSKFIIFGTRSNIVKVLNFADKSEYFVFDVHNNWVRNLVTTPDSTYFITCSADKTMRIVNIRERTEEFNLEGHEGYVFGLSLSKDGQFLLSGASDKTLRKWKIGKPSRVTQLRGHSKCIMSLAISSNSKYIVSGAEDKIVKIWEISTKAEIGSLIGHTETVWGVAITKDMKNIVSVSGDKLLKIWDFRSHDEVSSLTGHENPIFCVTTSHDNKLAISGAQDKLVLVWDIENSKLLKRLEGHTDTVFTVKVTHDNNYAISGAADYTIRIWDLLTLTQANKIETKSGMIESVALNYNDSLLVLGDRSNAVHLWDWKSKLPIIKFTAHTKWVKAVAFASDGNLMASCSNDFTMRVWNASEQRQEFMMYGHSNTIRCVAFTGDNKYIVSCSEDLSVRVWDLENVQNLEVADHGSTIDSFIYLSKIKQEKPPRSTTVHTVFSSLRINLVHVYCYLGLDEYLKKALELGGGIIIDTEGHSPLYYAIQRNSQNCIDVLFTYMAELLVTSKQKFLNYCNALREDFIPLLSNSSAHLPDFLEALFHSLSGDVVPRFAVPLETLPILRYSEQVKLDPFQFVHKEELEDKLREQPVEFKSLPFAVSLNIGSNGSIEMLRSITQCCNTRIYRTSFIRILIQSKWKNLWNFILFLTALSWANLILMICLIIIRPVNSLTLSVVYCMVNLLLLIYELSKSYSLGISTYLNLWNVMDLIRATVCYVWIAMCVFYDEYGVYYLTWAMVLTNFWQGLSGFRAFDATRFYIRLIFRAVYDSLAFILVFAYSTLAFGVLNYTAKSQPDSNLFFVLWQAPYQLNMEVFQSGDVQSLEYVYFVLAGILNVVVMLNLLISILGDSFDKFRTESVELDCIEMIEFVIELEDMMFWKREHNEMRYFQICQDPKVEGSNETWEGRVRAITSLIYKCQEENKNNFKTIQDKLKEVSFIKAQFTAIEQKLDKLVVN